MLWISTRRRGRSLGQMARDELGAIGGGAALVGVLVIMVILIAVLALVVVQGAGRKPVGRVLHRHDHPHRALHGLLSAVPASRAGRRSLGDRLSCCCCSPSPPATGSPKHPGAQLVQPVTGHGVVVDHHLRFRGVGASGVAAARAARLPVDVHEGRHHRPAGGRHLHRASDACRRPRSRSSPPEATDRCSPARCSRSCSSPSLAERCPDSTR